MRKHLSSILYSCINMKEVIKCNQEKNVVESSNLVRYVRILGGASVFTIKSSPKGIVTSSFTLLGFSAFIFWYSLYFYSFYIVYDEDQTIIRALYNTRLKHYADVAERINQILLVLYAIWKVPFDLSGSTDDMQLIVDIDKALQDLGEAVDYTTKLDSLAVICFAQLFVTGSRVFSIWLSLRHLDKGMPLSKVFQMVFTDYITFIIVAQYCTYLLVLRRKYKALNKILRSVKVRATDFFIVRMNQPGIKDRASELETKYSCKKIKACGKIYGMVYKATETVNVKFGSVILSAMAMALLVIILHLYYFMEATASGLFHDLERYVNFLIYVSWQICFSISIEFFFIYFSELAAQEGKITPQIIHEIINSNSHPEIIREAFHFSLQTLHQTPVFTARGLYKLNYAMLLEGTRSVTTYLVILLQFVTDKRSNI